jgi:xanthine/CO dehydrogenase XdhC/CoxF family maturation factor
MTNWRASRARDPDTAEPEWLPAGQDPRDVARQLRVMLTTGTSFAIATALRAHGTVLRQPGTLLVISASGETIGFNPADPLDGAIRDLAATALATGHDQLGRLEIDQDAASYIGLSGGASLDVHARRVQAGAPVSGDVPHEAGEDDLTPRPDERADPPWPRRIDELPTLFLFEKLTQDQLGWLCREGRVEHIDPGPVFGEGEPADRIYVLLDGEVVLSRRAGADNVELNNPAAAALRVIPSLRGRVAGLRHTPCRPLTTPTPRHGFPA